MAEHLMYPNIITEHGVFRGGSNLMNELSLIDTEGIYGIPVNSVFTAGDVQSYELIGGCTPELNLNFNYPWTWVHPTKSAREQVQDEILTKMAEAIEANDLKKAKQLVTLAKALKEL